MGKAQSHRNEQYQRIATAALICLALRLSGSVALDSSEKSVMGGILAYALPILVGSYFAFIMAQGGAIRLPKIWLRAGDYVQALLGRINERLNGSVKNASEKEGQP